MARRMKPVMERHHRKPRSRGGNNSVTNTIVIRQSEHRAYHALFGNMLPNELAAMLTDTFIDPDYYLVAVPRKRKRAKKRRSRLFCTSCNCEVLKCIPTTHADE